MAVESCGNALMVIGNQENLGFGTWGNLVMNIVKVQVMKLVKNRYLRGDMSKAWAA